MVTKNFNSSNITTKYADESLLINCNSYVVIASEVLGSLMVRRISIIDTKAMAP
jgi:hypothetical protein